MHVYELRLRTGGLEVFDGMAEAQGADDGARLIATCDTRETAEVVARNHDPAHPPTLWYPDSENGNGAHDWYSPAGDGVYFAITGVEVLTRVETEAAGWS